MSIFYTYTHDKLHLDKWIPFYVGKGKLCVNNGEVNKMVRPEEITALLADGWKRGRK